MCGNSSEKYATQTTQVIATEMTGNAVVDNQETVQPQDDKTQTQMEQPQQTSSDNSIPTEYKNVFDEWNIRLSINCGIRAHKRICFKCAHIEWYRYWSLIFVP